MFTKAYERVLAPGLAFLDQQLPAELDMRSPFALAWKDLTKELDRFINHGLAAA